MWNDFQHIKDNNYINQTILKITVLEKSNEKVCYQGWQTKDKQLFYKSKLKLLITDIKNLNQNNGCLLINKGGALKWIDKISGKLAVTW